MSDDDEKARDWADGLFIRERLQALDKAAKHHAKAGEDAYRRAIIDLLRTRTPGPHTLQQVAGELEELWWPKKYKRRNSERAFFRYTADLKHYLEAEYREQGMRAPATEAEKMTAKEVGLGVEALRRRKGRYKKRARL
jgi:hypothetical protein